MNDKIKALLALFILVALSGGTPPYIKLILTTIPPFTFTAIRFCLSFLVIFPIFLYLAKPRFKKDNLKLILLSSLSSANIFLFSFGIKLTTASISQTIYSFTPILVSLLSFFILREKITTKKIIGIFLGFLGVNLVLLSPVFLKGDFVNSGLKGFVGNLLIFIGCIGYSYNAVLSKKFLKRYTPLWLTVFFIFTTGFISLFFVPFESVSFNEFYRFFNLAILWPIAYVIIISTVVAYFLQQYMINKSSPLIASLAQYLFPFSTLIWSYFILGEQLNPYMGLGLLVILSGAWFVSKY